VTRGFSGSATADKQRWEEERTMATTSVEPRFVVDSRGRRRSVLLSMRDYEGLLQRLEDLEDALALDEAVRGAESFRDYADVRQELQEAGRL